MLAVDRLLDGHAAVGADRVISPPEFIRELRAVTVLILAEGDPAIQLTDIPEHHDHLAQHYARRDTARAQGTEHKTVLSPCPRDVTLLSAVIPCAVDALLGGSLALQIVLEPIATRATEQGPRLRASHLPARFGFTPALTDVWNHLLAPRWQRIRRLGIASAEPASTLRYSARCIPQLLWKPVYDLLFAQMLADWDDQDLARRYCSLALARLGPCRSWRDAAHALDLQHCADGKGTGANHLRRIDEGPGHAFTSNLRILAAAFSNQERWVDYAQRRQQLSDGLLLPPTQRLAVQEACDIDLDHPHNHQLLELWLWQHATCGYWRAAPEQLITGIRRNAWRRFNTTIAPSTDALTALLEQHVLGQPVCPNTAHPSTSALLSAARQDGPGPHEPSARPRAPALRCTSTSDVLALLPAPLEIDVQRWAETLPAPRTSNEYERRARRYLRLSVDRGLGSDPCPDQILKARIQAFNGDGTPSSAELYAAAMRSFWKHQNARLQANDRPHQRPPTAESLRRDWLRLPALTADEARQVLVAATDSDPRLLSAVCLLLLHGMQVSGAASLRTDDFSTDTSNRLLVAGRYPRGKRFHLPIVEPAGTAIRTILKTTPPGETLLGRPRTAPQAILRFGRAPTWTGPPLAHPLSARLLKRTFRSLALESGADPFVLAILTTGIAIEATDRARAQIAQLPELVLARLGAP